MSERTYWRAKTMIKRNQVSLTGQTDYYFYFEVKKHAVRIGKSEDFKDNCTCHHGSIWGVSKGCSHIKAAREFIKLREK